MTVRETGDRGFDASRYLTQLNGRDYLEVKWRLLWLRTEHPEATIETELVRLDEGMALFKARVGIPGAGQATGWGSETAADFGDFIEKAETKALGRALAALGYGTQFCEDFEFRSEGEPRVVDTPVERPRRRPSSGRTEAATTEPAFGGVAATARQVRAIYAIANADHGLDQAATDDYARRALGRPPSELSRAEASELIDRLRADGKAR